MDSVWQILLGWPVVGAIILLLISVGFGVVSMSPPDFIIPRVCFSTSATVLLFKTAFWLIGLNTSGHERIVAAFLIFGVVGAAWIWAFTWIGDRSAPQQSRTASPGTVVPAKDMGQPPTLLDLFKNDFSNTTKVTDQNAPGYQLQTHDGVKVDIRRQVYMDFPARSKFVGFYISRPNPPSSDFKAEKTEAACLEILKNNSVQDSFDHFAKNVAVMAGQQGQMTTIQDLTFSGRVLIYHEEFLSIPQKADIINAYHSKSLDVQFMGDEYLGAQVIAWHQKHDKKVN